jgi:hypothetical protein
MKNLSRKAMINYMQENFLKNFNDVVLSQRIEIIKLRILPFFVPQDDTKLNLVINL